MNNITQNLIRAAGQPSNSQDVEEYINNTIDDLYEEPLTEQQEMEKELVHLAVNIPQEPEIQSNVDKEGYYDPYPRYRHKSAEAEMQDRLLTILGRPPSAPWGSLWIANSDFREQIALLNITKSEQRGLLRAWSDIEVLSQGDGNEDIVESDQNEFMLKIISYKSRSDNPEKGVRERTAHITQKSIQDQTVNLPTSEKQKTGFFNTLLGRKGEKS
jgi:hypothetical protein